MESFKSILVDIDATVPTHPALERAIRLARTSGARLTITDIMTALMSSFHHCTVQSALPFALFSSQRWTSTWSGDIERFERAPGQIGRFGIPQT